MRVSDIEHGGFVESEEYKPCAHCGELLEVGKKKEGIWHKDFPDAPSLVYHEECLRISVNIERG